MKGRLVVLALLAVACAYGQAGFIWDFSGTYSSTFVVNGDTTGWSEIWPTAVTGTNPNDYEIQTTIFANAGGGTYMHFLRADSTADLPATGSYVSVELAVPSNWQNGGGVALAVNQCTSGSVTQIGGTSISLHAGDVLRSVIWGTNLWVFINNLQVGTFIVPATAGHPGFGGANIPSGSWFTNAYSGSQTGFIRIGHHDTVAPNALPPSTVATSLLPSSVSLKWQGVSDDPVGIGVLKYAISRNGIPTTTLMEPEYADATVQPSTTYTYSVTATDYHGNTGAATSITVTTPPASAVDPRRVGIFSTGSYWGGGGEQIDTLSGNLHFTIPIATAQGRTGWSVPVSLVYDSQNWRNDNGVNWKLSEDIGYGFGWKLLIGSVTPYYTYQNGGVDHYVYTDANGAEYRLDHNNNGIWTSTNQSVYVWLDSTASPNRLHFRDGKFWVLGCTSGGTEADAGTMYPTTIEDTFGNQVIVRYDTAASLPFSFSSVPQFGYWWTAMTPNTSSRITAIEDARAVACSYQNLSPYEGCWGGPIG